MAIQLNDNELSFEFARGSGPGGQNVNKVASKAILRWNPHTSACITDQQRTRFIETFASKITVDGVVVIHANEFRDQPKNKAAALRRLQNMLDQIEFPPKERVDTVVPKGVKERRIDDKKRHGQKKADRRVRWE